MVGIVSAILASLFASGKDLCSKSLSSKINPTLSATLSFVFAIPLYLLALIFLNFYYNIPILFLGSTFFTFVILRASSDMFAELFRMKAFEKGDVSLVSGYIALSPIFLLITSPLITGDIPSYLGVIGVFVTTCGVFILTGQKISTIKGDWGIIYGIIAAFFFSINHCFDRLATFYAHPIVSGFWMTLLAALLLLPFNYNFRVNPKLKGQNFPWKVLIIRGVCEVLFMSFKLWALQFLQAPYVASLTKFALLFTIFGGGVIFNEQEFKRRIVGGIIIIIGSVIVVLS